MTDLLGKNTATLKDYSLNQHVAYKCSLVGVSLERADLRNKKLRGVNMTNANLRGADLSFCDLRDATLISVDLSRANLFRTDFSGADVSGSDFSMAYMKGTKLHNTIAQSVLFRMIMAKNALFIGTDLRKSDFFNAELLGARFNGALLHRVRNMHTATFKWWLSPWGGPQSYEPRPGWLPIDKSILGNISIQENAARERFESMSPETWHENG